MRTRQVLIYASVVCIVSLSIECLSYFSLVVLRSKGITYAPLPYRLSQEQKDLLKIRLADSHSLRGHHPILGWSPAPRSHTQEVTINSQGIRAEHEYSLDLPPNIIRVLTFGDSFTFGSDVVDDDTWESQLEARDPRLQVLNFGVGAYGVDQAYLRYLHEGVQFKAHVVIIGFMSENIYRNLNVFRPFYNSAYSNNIYTKPRFVIEDGALRLLRNPLSTREDYARLLADDEAVLKDIGSKDYYYQLGYRAGPLDRMPSVRLFKMATRRLHEQLNPVVSREGSYVGDSEAFRLTTQILEAFYCAVLQHQSLPVIAVYPDVGDFNRHLGHRPKRYEPLLQHLQNQGFRYLDLLEAFVAYDAEVPKDKLTVGGWGHYSRLGNQIVANYLDQYLVTQGLVAGDAITHFPVHRQCNDSWQAHP
jgi:hypothetical protein